MPVGPLPPFDILRDFFEPGFAKQLLDYGVANESAFAPTKYGRPGTVDPSVRVSRRLSDLGPLQPEFRLRILAMAPVFVEKLGLKPFTPSVVEIELVAHGDGAFYVPHIDTNTDPDERTGTRRMLSAVYYFYSEPKAFSGGALRFHAFGAPDADAKFLDVEPANNSLLVFPAWVMHEVRPVICPSTRFEDCRFAVNVWLRA